MKEAFKHFLYGVGSIFDVVTPEYDAQKYVRNIQGWEVDRENLINDWKHIGADIQTAMHRVVYEHPYRK